MIKNKKYATMTNNNKYNRYNQNITNPLTKETKNVLYVSNAIYTFLKLRGLNWIISVSNFKIKNKSLIYVFN